MNVYDSGRDVFLLTKTSKPPSKWDSIEFSADVHEHETIAFRASVPSTKGSSAKSTRSCCRSSTTTLLEDRSNFSSSLGHAYGHCSSKATRDSSWQEEVSEIRPSTAPERSTIRDMHNIGIRSEFRTPAGAPNKFFSGPKVARPRQELERDVQRTNNGEPTTSAMAVDECPSTVSSIRSVVLRGRTGTCGGGNSTTVGMDCSSAYAGMEPYIRTSITDRVHDGTYDTDTAHKATITGRVVKGKGGNIPAPDLSCGGKQRPLGRGIGEARKFATQDVSPGQYDAASGIDATSTSTIVLPLPRESCTYDTYIRSGLGQTTGTNIGPGTYSKESQPESSAKFGRMRARGGGFVFPENERWVEDKFSDEWNFSNRGPWDDVEDAWGNGGYIEHAMPRDCASYMPTETFSYVTGLDTDHLNKATFRTAMRRHPRRYAASFSDTQPPDWRITGDPSLGPGSYRVERAERHVLPAPTGGEGNADPHRASTTFRARRTPFDLRRLAAGYKTLKPRFATPRTVLYTSELQSGPPPIISTIPVSRAAATATYGSAKDRGCSNRICKRTPRCAPSAASIAVAVKNAVAADAWGIGGRDSKYVRLEGATSFDPVRDGSRRRALAATRDSQRGSSRRRLKMHETERKM